MSLNSDASCRYAAPIQESVLPCLLEAEKRVAQILESGCEAQEATYFQPNRLDGVITASFRF